MKVSNIKDFTNGWIIGDFEPSLIQNNKTFEAGHHFYPKGFNSTPHTHHIGTEYNVIISGKLKIDGKEYIRGDIFIFEPYDIARVEFLEDTDLMIIKTPSVPSDKYIVEE